MVFLVIVFICYIIYLNLHIDTIETPVKQKQTLIIYWNKDHAYQAYLAIFKEFEQEHNVKIILRVFHWSDLWQLLQQQPSTIPDLIEIPAPWVVELGARGYLQEITEEIKTWSETTDWYESTWQETSVGEKIYGIKLHHTAFGLFYNQKHFKSLGLDPKIALENLESFYNTIKVIDKKLPSYGFGFDPFGHYLWPFIVSKETPYLIKDNKIAINTPEVIKTLEILQTLVQEKLIYLLPPGGEEKRDSLRYLFGNEEISMIIGGPWDIKIFKEAFPELEYSVTMIPHLSSLTPLTLTAGTALAIPKQETKALIWALIQKLTALETEIAVTLESGMLMPRKSWAEHPDIQQQATVQLFKPLLANSTIFDIGSRSYLVPEITGEGIIFNRFFGKIIYSQESVEKTLQEFIDAGNYLLEKK